MGRKSLVDVKALKALVDEGLTNREIASRMGFSYLTIGRIVAREKLRTRIRLSSKLEGEILSMWQEGKSEGDIVRALSITRGWVISTLAKQNAFGEERFKSLVSPVPPSRAMIALAEHDPVIARALRTRLGKEEGPPPDAS